MMKVLVKAVAILVLAAIGAGTTVYFMQNCPNQKAEEQKQINAMIAKYISDHPQDILEKIAKSDNFGNTVKNFSAASDEEINNKISAFLGNNPSVLDSYIRNNASFIANTVLESEEFKNASQNLTGKNDADIATAGEKSAEQAAAPAENPDQKYLDHWEEMKNSDAAPFAGPKEAKVTVVEFFDFACGHCKALAPVMGQLVKNNPDVKFVFNPLYFMSEHSPYAAKASLAAFQKGKFVEVFEGIMTLPEMNEKTVDQILADEGLNVDEVKKMIEEKKIRRGVQDIDAMSQVLGINGVPMVIINGVPFYGRSLEDMQNAINSYK